MKYWLITDTHFDHKKIKEYCGRPDGYELRVIENMKRVIKGEDVIIHLGDFAFYHIDFWCQEYHDITGAASTWLVMGNHDRKSKTYYQKWFDVVADGIYLEVYGEKIYFSHAPVADFGYTLNIHGHFHNVINHQNETGYQKIKNDKQRLVSLEFENYMPVNLEKFIHRVSHGI